MESSARPKDVRQSLAQQGQKLRALYRSLGWSRADCAKFLHLTERCLQNWEAGRHPVPFAVMRLMRIHCHMELPGQDWQGWCISRGKLCTPEGHELSPHDAKWWSLLVRRAELGAKALGEQAHLKRLLGEAERARCAKAEPACQACSASQAASQAADAPQEIEVLVTPQFPANFGHQKNSGHWPQIQHWRGFAGRWGAKNG